MTHQNLVTTEKAIKAHSKRLKKQLKLYNQDLSLSESQTLLAKILGFNNFQELLKIVNSNNNLPVTENGKVDATKVIFAAVYQFNVRKVFRISIFDQDMVSEKWVKWSQQLENWLMLSGVNVTENICIEGKYNINEQEVGNIPSTFQIIK